MYSESFLEFWEAFPKGRKQKKRKAFEVWTRLEKDGEDMGAITDSARVYAASPLGCSSFVMMPTTFLNGYRWEDDPESWQMGEPLTGQQTKIVNTFKALGGLNGDRHIPKMDDESRRGIVPRIGRSDR